MEESKSTSYFQSLCLAHSLRQPCYLIKENKAFTRCFLMLKPLLRICLKVVTSICNELSKHYLWCSKMLRMYLFTSILSIMLSLLAQEFSVNSISA